MKKQNNKLIDKLKIITANKLKSSALVLASVIPLLIGGTSTAFAKDADHKGAVYLQTTLNPGSRQIDGSVNGAAIGNDLTVQDTRKSPEYKSELVLWGRTSWNYTSNAINNKQLTNLFGTSPGSFLSSASSDSGSEKWKAEMDKYDTNPTNNEVGVGNTKGAQTTNLVMTFPGWGAGNAVPNLQTGKDDRFDRNANDDFAKIDASVMSTAAQTVNSNLVGAFNEALSDFYAHVRDSNGNSSPSLSKIGMANMVLAVASGYMPSSNGATITYNDDGTFKGGMAKGTITTSKNPWNLSQAGKTVLTYHTPGSSDGLGKSYAYGVVKGGNTNVGNRNSIHYATDEYALTWMDIAIASISNNMLNGATADVNGNNNTVVGDQVNQFLYSGISSLLGLLGIKTADNLVFGNDGNFFKNGVFKTYNIIMIPFMLVAIGILGLVIVDAYRKSNMKYLTTNNVQSISSSVGRVFNAMIMLALQPILILGLVGLNQYIVSLTITLNQYMSTLAGATDNTTGDMMASFLSMTGISGVIMALLLSWVNIKFTFRYIARAISFALYYVTSPVIFALDSLRGDGGIFQWGAMTAESWKNMIGLIFQQSLDALGLAFALNLGRLIFGNGALISIIGYLSVEAITNALMGIFGVKNSTISDIAEHGQKLFNHGMSAARIAGAAAFGTAAAGGIAAMKSGRNADTKLAQLADQKKANDDLLKGSGGLGDMSGFGADTLNTATTASVAGTGLGALNSAGSALEKGITKRTDGLNLTEGKSNAFLQGLKNKGVYGDKNTKIGKNGVINGSLEDAKKLMIDPETGKAKYKKKTDALGANVSRFLGGALGSTKQSMLSGAAGGLAAAIPGRGIDEWLGASVVGTNINNVLTGDNKSALATMGNSLIGRMVGISKDAMAFDDVSAYDGGAQSVMQAPGKFGSVSGNLNDPNILSTVENNEDGSYEIYSAYRQDDVMDPVLKTAGAQALTMASRLQTDEPISRDALYQQAFKEDGTVDQESLDLLNYMDSNGYSSVQARPDQNATVWRSHGTASEPNFNINSNNLHGQQNVIKNNLLNSDNKTWTNSSTGQTFKLSPNGDVRSYGVSKFSTMSANKSIQEAAGKIQKMNINTSEKANALKDIYSSRNANNVEYASNRVDGLNGRSKIGYAAGVSTHPVKDGDSKGIDTVFNHAQLQDKSKVQLVNAAAGVANRLKKNTITRDEVYETAFSKEGVNKNALEVLNYMDSHGHNQVKLDSGKSVWHSDAKKNDFKIDPSDIKGNEHNEYISSHVKNSDNNWYNPTTGQLFSKDSSGTIHSYGEDREKLISNQNEIKRYADAIMSIDSLNDQGKASLIQNMYGPDHMGDVDYARQTFNDAKNNPRKDRPYVPLRADGLDFLPEETEEGMFDKDLD